MDLVRAISDDESGIGVGYKGRMIGRISKGEDPEKEVAKLLQRMGYDFNMIAEYQKNLEILTSMAMRIAYK